MHAGKNVEGGGLAGKNAEGGGLAGKDAEGGGLLLWLVQTIN